MPTSSQGRTAIYRFYDQGDRLLYVGIAEDPKQRWAQHAADKPWWQDVVRRDVEWLATREAAEATEREAIICEKPLHNAKHALPEVSSEEIAALFAEYKATVENERALRGPVKEAAAHELKAGRTVGQLARLAGLSDEFFRRLARAIGVERKREPTIGREAAAKKQAAPE